MKKHAASKLVAGGLLTLGLLLGTSGVAFAYGGKTPVITANPSSCPANTGCTTTVTGANFVPDETVTLTFSDPVQLATVTTSSVGGFVTSVTIPPSPTGQFIITATGSTGDSASTGITLTAAVTATSTATTSSAPLAFTGADISVMLAVAAMAIAVGGILVLSSRRKVRAEKE